MKLKLVPKLLNVTLNGQCRGIPKGADRVANDVVCNTHQIVHVLWPAIAIEDSLQDFLCPTRSLPTRCALTAGFVVVEPGDDKALAVAMRRVLSNPELAASLARAGRDRAEERFDARRNVAVMRNWFCARTATRRGEAEASPTASGVASMAAPSTSPVTGEIR